jgi:serine/threonine protein phosphatase PrpC
LAVSRGLGDYRFKDLDAVLSGSGGENNHRNTTILQRQIACTLQQRGSNDGEEQDDVPMLRPSEQKVSPVPDIIVQNRDPKEDEFIIIACDGIWDVQTNQECVGMVSEIFSEGESDLGLVCEEILDLCLIKGSKDNMTSAVIKFPKQTIGKGGGVTARRERRGASEKEVDESQAHLRRVYVPPALREQEASKGGGGDK